MAQVSTIIYAVASAYVDSDSPDTNFQGAELPIYRKKYSDKIMRAVLGFNPDDLPQGKKVKAIYAQLYFTANDCDYYPGPFMINYISNEITPESIGSITYNSLGYTSNTYYSYDIYRPTLNTYSNMALSNVPYARVNAIKKGIALAIGYQANSATQLYKIASHTSANPPRLSVISEDVAVSVDAPTPASGFVNKALPVAFSWGVAYDSTDVIGTVTPASAKYRYRVKDAGSYTEVTAGAASYTLPANTLDNGNYEWQVVVTTNAGTTATSDWMAITTIDATPVATPVSPKNAYVNGEEAATFSWTHDISTGTAQTGADLQYSVNGVDWLTLASVTGSANSTVISANTFGGGNVYWRVRTYNANGVAGSWSDTAMFYAIAPVTPPVISSVAANTARPTFSWTAATQAGFKLEILQSGNAVYESGPVISTAKSYRMTDYLPDGNYTVRLMVYDNTGAESTWAVYNFSVSTVKPTAPTLAAEQIQKGVTLAVTGVDDGAAVYILRDGIPIAKGAAYKDYATTDEHVYIARAIDANHCYADSAPVMTDPQIRYTYIAAASNLENCVSLIGNKGEPPKREYSWSPNGASSFYAGNTLPVYEQSQQREESGKYSFSFMSKGDFEAFMAIANQHDTVLYRDRYGAKIWAAITGLSYAVTRITYDVTFSLLRVRHREGIDYD